MKTRPAALIAASVLGETAAIWLKSRRVGGNVAVRCRQGHLFTTVWIPGASAKSLRLGWWRLQRCPVGHHWSIVTPVREDSLSARERRAAHRRHDIRIP